MTERKSIFLNLDRQEHITIRLCVKGRLTEVRQTIEAMERENLPAVEVMKAREAQLEALLERLDGL